MSQNKSGVKSNITMEELDLFDCLAIFWNRRKLIGLVSISGVILALVICLLLPKVYQVDTLVEIGEMLGKSDDFPSLPPSGLIESPVQLKIKTLDLYSIRTFSKFQIPEEKYPKLIIDTPSNLKIFKMSFHSTQPQLAIQMLADIDEQILKDHLKLMAAVKNQLEDKIKTKELEIGAIEKESRNIETKLQLIRKDQSTIAQQLSVFSTRIQEMLKEKANLNIQGKDQKDPLVALFFTNEIQSNQRYYNELERSMSVGLPKEELEQKQFLEALNKKIDECKLAIRVYESGLENMRGTTVIKPAGYINYPIGPKTSLITLTSGFLFLFGSLFLSLCLYYREMTKPGIREVLAAQLPDKFSEEVLSR
jgi:hypothetical protein